MNFIKRSWGETHSEVFGYKFLFVKKTKFLFSSSSSAKRQLHEMNEWATNNCCFPELKPPENIHPEFLSVLYSTVLESVQLSLGPLLRETCH